MTRIHGHAITKSPRLMGGPDEVRLPCAGRRDVYDALVETTRDRDYEANVEAARNMCATCILSQPDVARACLDRNRGERWRAVVLGRNVKYPDRKLDANQRQSKAARTKWAKTRAARLADLQVLIAAGTSLEGVCASLGISRNGLYNWCRKNGHLALWEALNPEPKRGNQYRKIGVGEITTRRRGKVAAA